MDKVVEGFRALSAASISDAMDRLGLHGMDRHDMIDQFPHLFWELALLLLQALLALIALLLLARILAALQALLLQLAVKLVLTLFLRALRARGHWRSDERSGDGEGRQRAGETADQAVTAFGHGCHMASRSRHF